jgi:hypothetical protein
VPVVENSGEAEWIEDPRWSAGFGFGVFVPFRRVYDVDAVPTFALRFGPWLGPARVRAELAWGGAHAHSTNANLVGYAFRSGLLFDALLLHTGHVGLGVAAGYDVTAIAFDANIKSLSHDGSGFRGWIHGPRAGLSLALLPPLPPGPAFRARPDAASGTLEIFTAALWSQDRASATAALFITLNIDASW